MRVKICGLMRSKDVMAALEYGADAVGFVVGSPSSRRNLSLSAARRLMKKVGIFATRVAVTSSLEAKTIRKIGSKLSPDALQLHQYDPELIRMIRRSHPEIQLILATAVRHRSSIVQAKRTSRYSDAVLADTPSITGIGGTGRTHDWELSATLREAIYPHPLILAGGLTPSNVRLAIRKVDPFAVDVSTGVEERIGVKDHLKIREFIMNAWEDST